MENGSLLRTMEKCGHFLYHRRGGKRGQLRILCVLTECESITQTELARRFDLKSGSVSETVKKLEAGGYIKRTQNSGDKRQFDLKITEDGKAWLSSQFYELQKQAEIMFDSLNDEEKETLEKLLERLLADWESKFDESLFFHRKEVERRRTNA